jgi:hypothetical protein
VQKTAAVAETSRTAPVAEASPKPPKKTKAAPAKVEAVASAPEPAPAVPKTAVQTEPLPLGTAAEAPALRATSVPTKVGKVVDREFLWPDDTPATAGGG